MKLLTIITICTFLIGGCVSPKEVKVNPTNGNTGSNTTTASSGTEVRAIDYVIFGKFCGRCRTGNCAPMYKLDLQKSELTRDNSNHYSEGVPLTFNEKLSSTNFELAKSIPTKMPDSLFLTKETSFGCPNCADQCGVYLEFKSASKKYAFILDTNVNSMNAFLRAFTEELIGIIDRLKTSR